MCVSELRCEYLREPLAIECASPRLSWVLCSGHQDIKQKSYRVIVSKSLDTLQTATGSEWDSGIVQSAAMNQIEYSGNTLQPQTTYYWRVCVWLDGESEGVWSETASWSTGIMGVDGWQGKWLSYPYDATKNARLFRKQFNIDKPVQRALLYSTARGIYVPYVNGKPTGEDYFAPGWTDYKKRIYYQTYDVTDSLAEGLNVLGGELGEGWYKGAIGYGGRSVIYGFKTQLLMNLRIVYCDGTVETISTDDTWKTHISSICEDSFLYGQKEDLRLLDKWASADYDDSAWLDPHCMNVEGENYWDISRGMMNPAAVIETSPSVPVRAYDKLSPVGEWVDHNGSLIFDLGQNFAGVARLRTNGANGTIVRLRHAEVLNPDKSIYVENLRSANSVDEIILGGGEQEWQPSFTFHGFRYVEVTGLPRENILEISGIPLSSSTEPAGTFSCSNEMVNKLHSNIRWTQRSNFIDIPTDCPQRDERLGWTGDAQVFIKSAAYNMDVASFFTKWLVDLEDTQDEAGAVSNIAPHVPDLIGRADAAWGDAATVCPWWIYQYYGDKRILKKHYGLAKKWVEYLTSTSENNIRSKTHCYGDWLSIDTPTPNDVIQTAFYAYSSKLLSQIADEIDESKDAVFYAEQFEKIKESFIKAFVSDDGHIKGDTQTCYVLGLHFDLLPENLRSNAVKLLKERIMERNCHLSTGFVGTPYLMNTLSENGLHDIAMKLLQNDTYPSWGYSIKNGATTIWERWNGWTEKDGCGNANMNSYSHYAYGSVCEWMYSTLAGIKMGAPGFEKVIISPAPGEGITWVDAEYKSIRGVIKSSWKTEGNMFNLKTTIPANTTARVILPAGSIDSPQSDQFLSTETDSKNTFIEIGSGSYEFTVFC